MSLGEGFAKSLLYRFEIKLGAAFRVVSYHVLSTNIKIALKSSCCVAKIAIEQPCATRGFKSWGVDPASS